MSNSLVFVTWFLATGVRYIEVGGGVGIRRPLRPTDWPTLRTLVGFFCFLYFTFVPKKERAFLSPLKPRIPPSSALNRAQGNRFPNFSFQLSIKGLPPSAGAIVGPLTDRRGSLPLYRSRRPRRRRVGGPPSPRAPAPIPD